MKTILGVVHGKTVELETDPGLREGEPVTVVLCPRDDVLSRIEALRRIAEAPPLDDAEYEGLDRIIAERETWAARETPE